MRELGFDPFWQGWQSSPRGKDDFLVALSAKLYADPGFCGFEDRDDAAEALVAYRARIEALLDRYVDRGSSFDAYVVTSLRFLARSQRRTRKRHHERECACERALVFDYPSSDPWDLGFGSADEGGPIPNQTRAGSRPRAHETRRHRRAKGTRILYLFLKCAWNAGDRETKIVAAYTGLSEEWLATALAHARRFLESERCRFERISARRDRSWTALRVLEGRIAEEFDEWTKRGLLEAFGRARREYEAALAELRRFRPLVPNSVVARILRVPKGSVDSGLHYLRNEFGQACLFEAAEASLPAWNFSSPPATPTSSSNSAPSSRGTGFSAPPMSAIQPLTSTKTARPISRTPSKRLEPSTT